ncbi:MAG: hypothetical protein ACT4OJ_08770 [Bacteroidota bacterium]
MKAIKSFNAIFFAALASVALMILAGASTEYFPLFFAATLLLSAVPTPRVILRMGLQVELWESDVVKNLYKNNKFAMFAYSADQFVLKGKVVHIPVAGAPRQVKKNLAVFPQAAIKRTDNDITYAIDTFYLLPRQIEEIEKYELSYEKRQSVVGEDEEYLIQCAMDNLLYKWAPAAANTILTDGVPVDATLSGAAGQRASLTKQAFKDVFLKFNATNIPDEDRVALLTAHHYSQFFESLSEAEKTDIGRVADLAKGVVGEYMGFKIMRRSEVLRFRGADGAYAVVDELDDAYAADADDRAASLFWQKNCVERAKGSVKMFDNPNDPLYYGDVFSMILRLGGRQRRAAGVWAAVEAIV